MEWSLIFTCFHIETLCKSNGHRSFISRPSTKVLVIDLSYRGPLQKQWSSIFHIEALYKGIGHRSFVSRHSAKVMVIDLSYQDPLRWNGHWFSFDLSYRGPLQRYWSSIFHIEALCKGNGHRSFISRPSSMEWSLIFIWSFISRPSAKQWSLIFHIKTLFDGMVIDFHMLSYRGALQKQWSSIFHIKALSDGMVIDFLNVYIDVVSF